MINKAILEHLRKKTGKTIQRIYQMIAEERKKRRYAIRKETAAYILAGDLGIDISKYLTDDELAKVSVFVDVGTSPNNTKSSQKRAYNKKTPRTKVYQKGESYDFYKDLQKIIKSTRKEVCIVDAYVDEEIFNLYVDKLRPNTTIKILTKNPKGNFTIVASKFKNKPKYSLEVRVNQDVHDRMFLVDGKCWVTGQSVKDAGKKPTYLFEFENKAIESVIKKLWNDGTAII